MGQLVNGKWKSSDVRDGEDNPEGEFKRKPTTLRDSISEDSEFPPESDRYHLYVAYACPWAHRTLLMRNLKGLQKHLTVSFVSPYMLSDGWSFKHDYDSIPEDPIHKSEFLREIYTRHDSDFTGKVTVPILYDKIQKKIVNNESSEIIRILNQSFSDFAEEEHDFYPQIHQSSIEQWNEEIYHKVNNGVYKCGFATSQDAYETAFDDLFDCLEKVDSQLQKSKYLCGDDLTEADVRLFPTLLRFDPVYHTHFKCNGRQVSDFVGLNRFLQEFLSLHGVKETINLDHVKAHYYYSHAEINPTRIIAKGPLDLPAEL